MIAFSERNVNAVTIKPTLYIKTFYDSNVKFKYLNSAKLTYTFIFNLILIMVSMAYFHL